MNDPGGKSTITAGARIPPVDFTDPAYADVFANVVFDADGRPLLIFQMLAHNQRLLRRFNSLGALMRTSTITELRHREVIVLRIAFLTDCTFEFDQHIDLARQMEISEETIAALRGGAAPPEDPVDRLLVKIADDIYASDVVSDETWAQMTKVWSPSQMIELVMTAGFFRMAASTINSIGLRLRKEW
jgi:4-carboxymuconolactone decarboxylase